MDGTANAALTVALNAFLAARPTLRARMEAMADPLAREYALTVAVIDRAPPG